MTSSNLYALLGPDGTTVLEWRSFPEAVQVGPGAEGEFANMRPATTAEQLTMTAPPKAAQVQAFRDARLAAGFTDTAPGVPTTGLTFACDPDSRASITAIGASAGLALALNIAPAPSYPFIAGSAASLTGATVTMTPTQAYAWSQRVMAWVSTTYLYADRMVQAILAGNPPADITQGWP